MDRVVVIHEDNHGMIGLAISYKNAVKFLIENNWLDGRTEIVQEDDTIITVQEDLGEDWQNVIIEKWNSFARFNEYFEGLFHLGKEEVYEADW